MEVLKQRILQEGVVMSDQVLKLDGLLNHQIDPALTMEMGREFAARFRESGVTRVITVESSGIPVAFAAAYELGVPLVFARRKKTLLADPDAYCERVPSFTKGIVTDIMVSREYIHENDRILFIDDIIANGDAARGVIKIIERSGAELVGFGVVVEKCFQAGARTIREQGIPVEALVRIRSLNDGTVQFDDNEI
ncbi:MULTISPECIES: xanthine phosphoribosyltransferase [Paenibacillus]|uniref:Xanthine phosphoribosyltransferase n=1 Tax=Paenibacillus vandeheii TaxID=3035917 RepID=A0ABT8J7J2_9BACL|nr:MULTISPECIES: xanthine phosphoribosyltransferase [Paenibacillus]KGP82321.1 xanthine phosphoribosyltransferase [Paenibacillus sp. MAEPY1]KGP84414.1 xanthine phosphoribosyltransferase [Paenibacillus sp. MAEPY2]MDN4600952.1 xanthine phosphoribosyltransferase [Paenibacillus vandeheii]MDN8589859.1 xanthine phosphoribosyltransferase [Paenibacillus sp. 11B]OZQ70951.1 xanthine phosphoribosyltransferase [Paenibacillus taichungensis]